MRKYLFLILLVFLTGCSVGEKMSEQVPAGVIGTDFPISRAMTAKTIALAFYTNSQLEKMETKQLFSDVSEEDWAYSYICACVEKGFLAGGEEGDFRPDDPLTLWEAWALTERLAPDMDSRILLTEETKGKPVSYELWIRLLETALKERRGEDSLYSYGIRKQDAVLLSEEGIFDTGIFAAAGENLSPYQFSRITFWEKEGEILALLSVEETSPMVQNIYCRKEKGKVLLETGEGTAILKYSGKIKEGLCDVKLEGGRVSKVIPAASLGRCEVKRVSREEIYLEGKGVLQWAEKARIYDTDGRILKQTDLICGLDGAEYFEKDGKVCGAVLREKAVPERIRVFLKGREQEQVILSAENGFILSNGKAEKKFKKGEKAVLTADLPWFDYGILTAEGKSPVCVTFSDGTSYSYEGTIEMERRSESSFSVINELPLERYLVGVVPNEMPVSFGQGALEAQAIAARSFAYNQFYGNTYCGYGAHVTDTASSQVYLGYNKKKEAEQAVQATEGLCAVTADGAVAQTYFYSTSCGFGAGSEEVWSADGTFSGTGKSYLQAKKYGDFKKPETEKDWLSFWQDWERAGYDDTSPWYRWKVYFGCRQLTEILQKTLAKVSNKVVEGDLSEMGNLQGLSVEKRGEGGIVMELKLAFEKGVVTVKTENAIRKALSPTKITIGEPIYLQRKSGDSLTGQTMLPSGFFAVKEMKNEAGELTGIALYGGGNGHGVGMSQYGAKGHSEAGKTAKEIIEYYFPGTKVEKVI